MIDLYSLAINGDVIAENMWLANATIIAEALVKSGAIKETIESIEIQRVSENDE